MVTKLGRKRPAEVNLPGRALVANAAHNPNHRIGAQRSCSFSILIVLHRRAMSSRRFPPPWAIEEVEALMMNDHNEDPNQPDEGDLLRDEVSDEALETAASVATGGLPTPWYSSHCFGCPSWPALGRQVAQQG